MTNFQTATILASLIGTMLSEYKGKERKKGINELSESIRKQMHKYGKSSSRDDMIFAINHADEIWQKAVAHFMNENMIISAPHFVVTIYSQDQRF